MYISVYEQIGANAITLDDGQIIYDLIHPILKAGESVELDFENVETLASPFLNASIGQLLKDMEGEHLNKYLNITHLSSERKQIVRLVIENAKEYYSGDLLMQKHMNEILAQDPEDH
jgi:hypothetical protein